MGMGARLVWAQGWWAKKAARTDTLHSLLRFLSVSCRYRRDRATAELHYALCCVVIAGGALGLCGAI